MSQRGMARCLNGLLHFNHSVKDGMDVTHLPNDNSASWVRDMWEVILFDLLLYMFKYFCSKKR